MCACVNADIFVNKLVCHFICPTNTYIHIHILPIALHELAVLLLWCEQKLAIIGAIRTPS